MIPPSSYFCQLVTTVCIHQVFTYQVLVTMDEPCPYTVHKPNEHRSFKIQWRGSDTFQKCKVGFVGSDRSNYGATFRVCVEAIEFFLQSTDTRLSYSVGEWQNEYRDTQRTYVKGDEPEKFCANESMYLDIQIQTDRENSVRRGTYVVEYAHPSYITLVVTAVKAHEFQYDFFYVIAGSVIGGLVLLIMCCVAVRRHRQSHTRAETMSSPRGTQRSYNATPQVVLAQPVRLYSQQQHINVFVEPPQPPRITEPRYHQETPPYSHQHSYADPHPATNLGVSHTQTTGVSETSAPPPSYSEVIGTGDKLAEQ